MEAQFQIFWLLTVPSRLQHPDQAAPKPWRVKGNLVANPHHTASTFLPCTHLSFTQQLSMSWWEMNAGKYFSSICQVMKWSISPVLPHAEALKKIYYIFFVSLINASMKHISPLQIYYYQKKYQCKFMFVPNMWMNVNDCICSSHYHLASWGISVLSDSPYLPFSINYKELKTKLIHFASMGEKMPIKWNTWFWCCHMKLMLIDLVIPH